MTDHHAVASEIELAIAFPLDGESLHEAIVGVLRRHYPASGDGELDRIADEGAKLLVSLSPCDTREAARQWLNGETTDSRAIRLQESDAKEVVLSAMYRALGIQSPDQPASGKGG